jgi:hypothetical protein
MFNYNLIFKICFIFFKNGSMTMRGRPSMSLKFLKKYTKFWPRTLRRLHDCTNNYQSIIRIGSVSEAVELTTPHDHHSFHSTVCSIQCYCMLYAWSPSLLKYFTFMLPCIVIVFFSNNQPDALIIQIYSVIKLYMFGASSLPIIRSSLLYIRHLLVPNVQ